MLRVWVRDYRSLRQGGHGEPVRRRGDVDDYPRGTWDTFFPSWRKNTVTAEAAIRRGIAAEDEIKAARERRAA